MYAILIAEDREQALDEFRTAEHAAADDQQRFRAQHAAATAGGSNFAPIAIDDATREAIAAHRDIVEGRFQAAVSRLRPLRNSSRIAARTLAEAHRAAGNVAAAVETLDRAVGQFSDPMLGVLATEMLFAAGDYTAVVDRAQLEIGAGVSLHTQRRLRRLSVQSAANVGDWQVVVDQSQALLAEDPDDTTVLWALITGLIDQARLDRAGQKWTQSVSSGRLHRAMR
jgi:hypothetical protein